MRLWTCVICLLALLAGPSLGPGQEWSRFRGPNGSGIMTTANPIPTTFSETNTLWKTAIPGKGHSSPVVWGNKLFLTSGDTKKGDRIVLCLDTDSGKILWQKAFAADKYKMHKNNSVATSTPTVDAKHLYVSWATPDSLTVMALDHAGNSVWQKEMGRWKGGHGYGVSPIVHDGLVILANDQDKGGSLLALDAQTGETRWELPRKSGNATYATPCIYQKAGQPDQVIFTNWQHGVTSVDPKTGKVNWELSVFEPEKAERSIASPVVAGDLILGTCGFVTAQKHFVAIDPGDAARKIEPKEVWRVEKSVSYLPTPLVKGDLIFLCSEIGVATCLEAKTGKVVWQERLGGAFYASPVCDGHHIFCVSTEGDVVVLAASAKFQIVARNELGQSTQSSPALAGGRIYIRLDSQMVCIGAK
jgi:outer membrane protein assembly factor BamB